MRLFALIPKTILNIKNYLGGGRPFKIQILGAKIWAQYLFWANLKHSEVGFLNFDFLRGAAYIPLVFKFRFRLSRIISAILSRMVIKIWLKAY